MSDKKSNAKTQGAVDKIISDAHRPISLAEMCRLMEVNPVSVQGAFDESVRQRATDKIAQDNDETVWKPTWTASDYMKHVKR